ncbi:MAG: hypothetical protein ACM3PU_08595 [Gemmatimonadota bacterium]
MLLRRRIWLYRLSGQRFAQSISFDDRVTAAMARQYLRSTIGDPLELWGRSKSEVLNASQKNGHHEILAV